MEQYNLLDDKAVVFLIFCGTSTVFSIVLYWFIFSPTVCRDFCHILFTTCYLLFLFLSVFCFSNRHPKRYEIIFPRGFDINFPDD